MRVLYVANHQSGGNDDEGAVTYALGKLGHVVECITEKYANAHGLKEFEADFLLCHHWRNLPALQAARMPKVFWCFDLISWEAPVARHTERRRWARDITEVCSLGFMCDGDWVAKDTIGRLHWLTQGADERQIEGTFEVDPTKTTDILFVGGIGYGRDKFVQEMREQYGERFKHILKGCHGAALADEVNRAKIVIAPDSPITDSYWSNRLYNMLRLGAFFLHPYCEGAYEQYGNLVEWYKDREQMHRLIKWALTLDQVARNRGAMLARVCTEANHTYSHRCAKLVRVVQEKLL